MSYFPSLTFSFIYEKKSALNLCIFLCAKAEHYITDCAHEKNEGC